MIMNPRSGGGKVGKFGLADKASGFGAEVALLKVPVWWTSPPWRRKPLTPGRTCSAWRAATGPRPSWPVLPPGGDVPMMVIGGNPGPLRPRPGLDRDNPASCLDALTDGVELRIDLGLIGGRTFVNNASFGAYAQVVQSPAYRDDKSGTALAMLPDLLSGHQGAHLVVRVDGQVRPLMGRKRYW